MQPPFHRLEEFVRLTSHDLELVSKWSTVKRRVPRYKPIRREEDPVAGVFFLMEGWVGSSLMLRNGRRQMVKIHLPGDMLGFPSLALARAGENLEALTNVVVCPIPISEIGKVFEQSSRLAAGLFLSTQKERVALMQELSWVGSATAVERLAALLLDLHDRLDAAAMVENGRFDMPLTQQHLGELLGLTAIHVNRTLKRLDETGFIERSKGWVRIIDPVGLRSLAPNLPPHYAGHAGWARLGYTTDNEPVSA
jgi:CRP-like cAMP-binding protein